MSHLLLIRHAQSANNALPVHQRVEDPGLTELGYRQAQATARALASYSIQAVYCSPFLRALETTRPIAEISGRVPNVRSDIFEEGGCYSGYLHGQKRGQPGMGRGKLIGSYPDWNIDDRIADAGWWNRDYESTDDARLRASQVRRWLEAEVVSEKQHLDVVVTHADFKRLLLLELLGNHWTGQHNEQLAAICNAGISNVEFLGSHWFMHSYNSTSHLELGLLSS